jgi:hypothetical protein
LENKTPQELLQERTVRFENALQLKPTDRVPVIVTFDFFGARYGGINCQEAMYDTDKMTAAWIKTISDFQPDAYDNPFAAHFMGGTLEALDFKQLKWPGHGVPVDQTYQFVEDEYMKASEYDHFLHDLSDFMVRRYWPRVFGIFSTFSQLPPLHELISYYMGIDSLESLNLDELIKSLKSLRKASLEVKKMSAAAGAFAVKMQELGFPPQFGSITEAPFDLISDFFRGMRGTMLDMYRQPDKLLAAMDKVLPIMVQMGVSRARAVGVPRCFIPLHKGSEGFMSIQQFKTFFWPTLRQLVLGLIDAGITPCLFVESDYTSRLEIMGDVPRGKVCYAFEKTDIFKAKEILGDHVCLRGNVPLSILCNGTPDDVRAYCKRLIDVCGKGGGYILDSAAGLDSEKPENVRAMIEFSREYGIYR